MNNPVSSVFTSFLRCLSIPALLAVSICASMAVDCAPAPSGLVGWWRAEGDATDTKDTHNGALVNGAHFEPGKVGNSFAFDGINQYVRVPDAPLLNPTNAITLEAWVYVDAYPNIDGVAIVAKGNPLQYQLALQSAQGRWFFRPWVTVPAGIRYFAGTTTVETNTWYHLALTYDGSTLKQYVNGVLDGSIAASGPIVPTPQDLTIGGEGSGWFFNGRVDDLSLYDRALASTEIQAIFAAGSAGKCVTPPCVAPPAGLVSWWRGEGTGIDQAGTNNATWEGTPLYGSGMVGQAFQLNGSGNRLRVPASPSLDVGKGDAFSVEGWIVTPATTTGGPIVEWTDGREGAFGVNFYANLTPGELLATIHGSDGTSRYIRTAPGTLSAGVFQHVALTYQKSSGIAKLFVNGTVGKEENFGSFTPVTTSDMYIGYRPEYVPFGPIVFTGVIDEISVYNRALANEELKQIYIAGAAGKCTAPTPPGCTNLPAGVVGWYKAEGNTVDISGNSPSGMLSNVVFSLGKVGEAFSFNGSNSFVEVPDSPSLRLTNQLSIEFWVKRLRVQENTGEFIVEKGGDWTGGEQNFGVSLHAPWAEGALHFLSAGGWWGAGSILDSEWHHCAIVARHGESAPTFYIDGAVSPIRFHEGASTINLYNSTRPMHIGAQIDPVSN